MLALRRFMLHSRSRGMGNAVGTMFIELAKQDAMRNNVHEGELKARFERAVAESKTLPEKPAKLTLLRIYAPRPA